jgi:glycosyltransferase involved in cell wall biosynthesis
MKMMPGKQQNKSSISGGLRAAGCEKTGLPNAPLVSIITVVHNGEKEIRQTLESVLTQDYAPLEYIVIDGASDDGTVAVLQQYNDRIDYWHSEPDAGISDAFNKGIRQARGEIIGMINCGDWYEAGAVGRVVRAFEQNPEAGVVCGTLQYRRGEERAYLCRSVPHLLERDMTVTHPTCFVRRDLFDRFGLYSPRYRLAMDYELLLRLKRNGTVFLALDAVLANMRHSGASESNWRRALEETHQARTELTGSSFFAGRAYFMFLVAKRSCRIVLERLGLDCLLRFYRQRLALVKKFKA